METVFWLVLLAGVALWLFVPRKAQAKSKSRSKKYRTSGAVLFGINKVLAPSAANAALIQDEQRESIRAIPTPVEDDIFRAV
jgi:hypothetical protein